LGEENTTTQNQMSSRIYYIFFFPHTGREKKKEGEGKGKKCTS
jgi:hypothetical protein